MEEKSKKLVQTHAQAIAKMGFEILTSIANGKEPLTYTFVDSEGKEHQIEANASIKNENHLNLEVDIDSNWGSRWRPTGHQVRITVKR